MLYPQITEVGRAGNPQHQFPRTQRDLVALSLRLNPTRTVRPTVERDHPRGFFR